MSMSDIGKRIINVDTGKNVSRERVRQIKDNALKKMRFYAGMMDEKQLKNPAVAQTTCYQAEMIAA